MPNSVVDDLVAVKVEEELVLDDRPADREAPPVLPQAGHLMGRIRDFRAGGIQGVSLPHRRLVNEIRGGVESVVLKMLVSRPVKVVASAPADLVENDATHAALRRKRKSIDLNLRDRLKDLVVVVARRQDSAGSVLEEVGTIRQVAIDRSCVAGIPRTYAERVPPVRRASSAGEIDAEAGPVIAGDPGTQLGQRFDGARHHNIALLDSLRLEERLAATHYGHLLRQRAHLQDRVFADHGHAQDNRAVQRFFEAPIRERNVAFSGRRRNSLENSGFVSLEVGPRFRINLCNRHSYAQHHGSRRIRYCTADFARWGIERVY